MICIQQIQKASPANVRQNNSPSQKSNQAESCGLNLLDTARTNHHHIITQL